MNERSSIAGVIDGQPEPDCLDGFAHPRFQQVFYGNPDAERALMDAASANRLHHAWLLSGPSGVGKATLAYRFAKHLLKSSSVDDTEAEHRVERQVAAFSHPNLLVLRRPWQDKNKRLATHITVGEVRRLRAFFSKTTSDEAWRVVIIDRADELNAAAANALLKNLEEPPARCVFLLITPVPGRLPVTIRSRCRVYKFTPLAPQDMGEAIRSAYELAGRSVPAEDAINACIPLAQGSVGRALRLLDGGGSALHERLMTLIADLPRLNHAAVHALADEITGVKADEPYHLFFELVDECVARIVTHGATGEGALGQETEMAKRLDSPAALAKFAQLWETVRRAKADADALNLDRKNLILGTFFRLEEVAKEAFA